MASKKVKPTEMWGWTNFGGEIARCYHLKDYLPSSFFGGTRIRVVVTPAKKPAKKGRKP